MTMTLDDPSRRMAKVAAFVVGYGDKDEPRQEAILQEFNAWNPDLGAAILLQSVTHMFIDHLKSEHGDLWPGVLLQLAHDSARRGL